MTEKACLRCGSCCKYLPLFTQHMHVNHKKYLLNRGLVEDKKQGCILIPHECQHLKISRGFVFGTTFQENMKYYCDIHDSEDRPHICKAFHGQKIMKGARIYIPPNCIFSRENEP